MSMQGEKTVRSAIGEWTIEWAGMLGCAYPKGSDPDGGHKVEICDRLIGITGCVPVSVVQDLLAELGL